MMAPILNTAADLCHERILASAGSGKTWQLTSRFLKLLRAGVPPEGILASTFTRLAAAQIRDRLLERIAEAATSAEARKSLGTLFGDESLTRADVLDMLASLARQVHDLNIRTLDSFLAAIVRAFALELGLPPASRIIEEEEATRLRREAIQRVLDEDDTGGIVRTIRRLTGGGTTRSVSWALETRIKELYEVSLETLPDAWNILPHVDGELDPPQLVHAINQLSEAANDPRVGSLSKTIHSDVGRARVWDWLEFVEKGIAGKLARGDRTYRSSAIDGWLVAAYQPVVRHAVATVVNRLRDQALASRDILTMFRNHYETIKTERGAITFLDLATALDRAETIGTLDDICFRIDRRLEHVLLDEFQDTSVIQWRALAPNMRELVSDETTGRTFFCVGDLKQSIYEWRDATPEILAHIPDLLFGQGGDELLQTRPLSASWRSAQPVIDAVNTVFASLTQNRALEKVSDVAATWSTYFKTHTIVEKHESLPGYVEVRTVEKHRDKDERRLARVLAAADQAQQLNERDPGMHIGVLTRSVKMSRQILRELQRRHIPVGGARGGPLTDVAAVNAVLDLLKLAEAPDDTAAAFHVANTALGAIFEFSNALHAGHRRAVSRRIRRQIDEVGLSDFLARVVSQIAPECAPHELSRVAQLPRLADLYQASGSSDLTPFIEMVSAREVDDARPAPVLVMTIHSAKGLEFDAVILPELESSWSRRDRSGAMYERDGVAGRITRICPYIKSELREVIAQVPGGPDLEPLARQTKTRDAREALCLLYVAMTRAKQALYMFIDPPSINKDGTANRKDTATLGGIVLEAVASDPVAENSIVRTFGDLDWHNTFEPDSLQQTVHEEAAIEVPIRFSSPARGAVLNIASAPSAVMDGPLGPALHTIDPEATDRGTAIHAMFELVEWLDENEPDDGSLVNAVRRTVPRRTGRWIDDRVREFREACTAAGVRSLLSRNGREGVSLWRERSFARTTDEGIVRGNIDRLEVTREGGRPVHAHIIDFKTDGVTPETVDDTGIMHLPQLESYRHAIADLYDLAPGAIETTLVFTAIAQAWRPIAPPEVPTGSASPTTFTETLFD